MAALTDLQTALLAKASLLTDAVSKAEAEAYIAEYIALRTAILSLSSATVSSYSIAGRTVTRADLPRLRAQAVAVRDEINNALASDASVSVAVAVGDMSGMGY